MNILLAIDASASSEAALNEVMVRRWPEGTNICVLSVAESTRLMEITPLLQTIMEATQSLVRNAAERLERCGVKATAAVVTGHPRSAIVEYAEKWGADFVFVGSHGMSGFTRFLLGSVAQHVVNHAPCSVAVIRERAGTRSRIAGEPMKILLATDGSDCASAAAKSIAGRPWTKASEIKVLGVADIVLPAMEPWYGEPGLFMRLHKEALEHEQEATAEAAKIVSSTGLTVSTAVLSGNPKAVIVDEAKDWQADLIVVGSYGRTGIDRFLLGSVSAAVAMHAHCSVEIIREQAIDKSK